MNKSATIFEGEPVWRQPPGVEAFVIVDSPESPGGKNTSPYDVHWQFVGEMIVEFFSNSHPGANATRLAIGR